MLGCAKTVPMGRMRIHIAFHLHSETLLPPCCGFFGDSGCVLRMRRLKGGGGHKRSRFPAQMGFF